MWKNSDRFIVNIRSLFCILRIFFLSTVNFVKKKHLYIANCLFILRHQQVASANCDKNMKKREAFYI